MAISYGTYTITEVQEGSQIWTSSVAPTSPNYTFTVSNLTGDSETSVKVGDIIMYSYYRYTVLSISNDGTTVLTGNRVSIRGATGASSVTYSLIVSNLAIIKDKDGNLSPSSITVTAKSQTGSNAMVNYTGRIKIETTTNNSTWTSRINEDASTKTYTIPTDTVAIRCSLYLNGGTTTLLDQQTIPVVSDGIDGTNVTITSTSVTYQKGTNGTVKPTGTWETNVQPVGEGEYLWTKTVVAYSDSSKTESYSVSRNAVNGTNGTSPTVTSTVTEYVQSNNGTTAPTSGWNTSPPSTVTAGWFMWTKVTVTYSDNATSVSYTVSKNGTNGNNGINTATVYLYKKGTTAPSVPSGNTTYTFSTKKLTGTLDSWSQTIPTTGNGECYVTAAVASSSGTTDTIATGEWSTPIQFNGTNGTNGTDGTNGLNQATIFLYKRGASVTKPTTSVTYTFSTGTLSAEPNSWKRNIPTIDGNPCWVVTATAIGNETTATITGSNWSDPVKLVEDGEDGKDAYTIVLTNENHTFAGNSVSAIASEMECNVIAYKGTTQIAATIGTITGQPTGMTTSLSNNGTTNASFTVAVTTNMVTKNGVLTIPITVDNKTFTKKFTYSLALKGISGTSENLLMDVYASSLTKVDAPWNRYLSDASNSTITGQFIAESNLPDPNATHFYRITDSSATTKGRGLCFYSGSTPPFIDGHTYRIGCWARKHDGSPKIQITIGSYGSWMPVHKCIENTEWEWFEVVHTFGETDASKTTQSDTYKRLYFYFYNDNVAGSSLDMCGFKMEEVQVNSGTARNFILGTEKLAGWATTQGATISNGVVTFPDVTADTWREACSAKSFKYDLIRNQYVIFSIKVKADSDKKCRFYLNVSVDNDETTHIRQKYFDQYIYFTGDGEWQTVCLAAPVFDYMFNSGSGTIDFDDCWVTIRFGAANNYWNGFQAKEPQLCLGTTATSWSRAPEDVDEAIDNIEIGGRNLLKGSDVTNTSLTTPLCGGTVTQTILSGTVITLSVQVDADDVVWGSSGNKRIGVASSIVKDGGGNQYIEAWAAMTGRTGTGIDKTFDTSFHGRVKSTYTLQGELPLDKAFSLYVQSVTSGTVSVSRPKLEIGNKATDWTPAPEDIEEEIASKADSSVAVEEEQLIYISKASGTNTVTGTTTWVTGTGDVQNTWTTKRPTYNSSYPVLFIAKQKKTVSGTVTCTTPLKDDTTTVIDGGHITTGTIDASQVTVTNIDASKITTGKLNANVIEANSLSISQISGLQTSLNGKQPTGDYATNNDVTTAINNIEIGGRNLIINTLNPSTISANRPKIIGQTVNTIGRGTASVAEHGIRFTTTSASYCYIYMGFTALTTGEGATLQGLTVGETYTFSCDFTCKIFSADTSTTTRYLRFYVYDDTSGSFASDKYQNMIDLDTSKKGTEQSGHFYYTFTLPTNITKFGFMVRTNVTTSGLFTTGEFIELRNIKLEKGSKATDWSPASEDINTEVNNAEENAKKVATNYLAIDDAGIMVADMENGQQTPSGILSGNNVFINNTSVNIRDGQNTLASFGTDGMQIGLDNETRTEQDYHSWKMIDKDDNIYAFVSDLRDEYGEATITEIAKLNEATQWSETNFEISSIISVTVNGEAPESYQKRLPKLIDITPEPTDEDVVVVTYTSQSPELKAYTFGKRTQDSNIGGYSFVEGADNVASGYASHAEGVHTTASGHDSHAEGLGTTASGDYSHAQNFYTTASSSCQTVVGRHNVDDTNNKYAFIVGNGHRNQSINKLDYANALGITWNGTMEIGGLMCGTLTENSDPARNLPTRTPIPLFKTVSWSGNSSDNWDNQVIPSNGEWYRYGFNIYQKGYRALGVVGFGAFNATSNSSNVTWCIVTKCYTWYDPNIITSDNHIGADVLDIYVWNQHQSQSAKVKVFARVLYIAESALVGVVEPGTPV